MRILTIGTFDLLHVGHLELFEYGSKLGDLEIGINSDSFVETFKAAPQQTFEDRYINVRKYAPTCIVHKNISKGYRLIEEVQPDLIIVGMDWHSKDYLKQIGIDEKYLNKKKIIIAYAPRTTGVSSSAIKAVT